MAPPHALREAPSNSFASCPHSDDIRGMRDDLHVIKVALVGDIQENEPGVLERLRELESFKRTLLGAITVIGTVAAGALITTIWQLMTKG